MEKLIGFVVREWRRWLFLLYEMENETLDSFERKDNYIP